MFRKKTENRRFIDMHCHILPGIDDGSKDMEETMAMLRQATDEGITEFIVTPHYKHGRRNAGPKTIHRLIEEVSGAGSVLLCRSGREVGRRGSKHPDHERYRVRVGGVYAGGEIFHHQKCHR